MSIITGMSHTHPYYWSKYMLQKRIILGRFKLSEKTVSPTVKMNQIQISISFLLLVSVCLTVRAAPLTDQLKELVKALSQEQRTNKVEQTAPADMQRHVLVPRQEAPTDTMFKPDNFVFGRSGAGNDWSEGHYTTKVKTISEVDDVVKRTVQVSTDLEPNVLDDVKNSPLAPMFHPDFMLGHEVNKQDSGTKGSHLSSLLADTNQ